ncbi:MAG: ferritin [Bacillota bacterium]
MLNQKMEAALNEQIKEELSSAYTYLGMAASCEANNYPGMAHWLEVQAREELEHAMKLYRHVNDRGGKVALKALPEPPAQYDSLVALFEKVLAHEQKISGMIHNLYELAMAEKEYASIPVLQWFINEQVEEEKSASDVLNMVKMAGGGTQALMLLDRELAKRQAEA